MKLRIDAHPDPMMGLLPMFAAIDYGMFAERGIEPEFVARTGVQAIDDVRDERIDLSFAGPTLTIMAKHRFGLPTRFVSAGAIRGTFDGRSGDFMNMLARTGVRIETPGDFAGKTLGAFALDGGITHSAPLFLFNRLGVDTSTVTWKPMPFHLMPDALAAGQIDVAICVEPLITVMLRRGLGYPVDEVLGGGSLAMSSTGNPSLVSNWWTSAAAYERNPELFEQTSDALNDAVDFVYREPDKAFAAMARHTGRDSGLLRDIGFNTSFFYPFASDAPEVRAMYANWIRVLQGAGLLQTDADADAFF